MRYNGRIAAASMNQEGLDRPTGNVRARTPRDRPVALVVNALLTAVPWRRFARPGGGAEVVG